MSNNKTNIEKTKLMFVCMGNICRSPTAHAVMQHKINQLGLQNKVQIESSGTHAYHVGEPSDKRSRAYATQQGVDMDYVRAQKIAITDYDEYDYILAMDEDNLELINYYAPENHTAKVSLFLDYAKQQGMSNERIVPDPYYGGEQGFKHVFELVETGCDALIKHLNLI